MFHRRTDASKARSAHLIERLRAGGFSLLDAQVPTPHLTRLGAIAIPRTDYLGAPAPRAGRRPRRSLREPARRRADRRRTPSGRRGCGRRASPRTCVSSARATKSAALTIPGGGARATPTLIVTGIGVPPNGESVGLDAAAQALATAPAAAARIAARDDRELLAAVAREDVLVAIMPVTSVASWVSTWSPAWWPCTSLIRLK